MKTLVTGGAGFIGSHLVDELIKRGYSVRVLDNLSSGKKEFIEHHFNNPNFEFHKVDLSDGNIDKYFHGIDRVFHLAANPKVRIGAEKTRIDLEQNILATHNVLEAMRKQRVKSIFFTSSSTVYGETKKLPTEENHSPLQPISLYGASKLACEALISAYCHTFGMNSVVFRLANVIGKRSTHGVVYNFTNRLRENPNELKILGNGLQSKSYIYITDCIEGMILAADQAKKPFEIFNIGSEDQVTVKRIAELISGEMGIKPDFKFAGGERGWRGDIPVMLLDVSKIRKFGWRSKHNSEEAVKKTTKDLLNNFKA
ncbi:MAG: NAD-dependent epimerase/dehydratase family protein [Candidatus Aenigmarchaeota archaeon]|nr:NAD-dependent epimerase/dehydratase family protein [Candidatus Aenigmarchaeota archaeon]